MKKIQLILLTAITLLMTACGTTQTVPLTGRKHRISVSDEQLLSLSQQQYSTYMQKAKKSTNAANTQMVVRVGRNLANAVETYLRNNGFASEVNNFHWEFNLIQDPQANAFCMPGGKIVVFEGILPYTQNEASLAIVLGHEIAHAVAKHSAEQMTKQQNQGVATTVLGSVLGAVAGQDAANVAGQIAGTGFSLLNLKYSRKDESEADYMGLIFAAMAGYDPANAITFWQRMSSSGSQSTQEWLSDHPSRRASPISENGCPRPKSITRPPSPRHTRPPGQRPALRPRAASTRERRPRAREGNTLSSRCLRFLSHPAHGTFFLAMRVDFPSYASGFPWLWRVENQRAYTTFWQKVRQSVSVTDYFGYLCRLLCNLPPQRGETPKEK